MALQTQDSDSETETETDLEITGRHERPTTWRERHALKLLGAIMAAMFALVIIVQVAC
jgi:hypothetical protein